MNTILKQDLNCIRLLLFIDDRIPSVNSIYEVNRKTGGLYRSPRATKVYQMVQSQITLSGITDFMPSFIKDRKYFKTKYQFILRYGFDTRDLSNMLKLVEDAIHRKLGIDDHNVIEIECVKSLMNNEAHKEFIIFEITPSDFNYNYFNEKTNEI